jgi:linoleoyl-CoA desaturase
MHAKTALILLWFAASYWTPLAWGGASAWAATSATVSRALATAGAGFARRPRGTIAGRAVEGGMRYE